MTELSEDRIRQLKTVVDRYYKEDYTVRERQVRTYKELKLFWDGLYQVWFDETAHDWRFYQPRDEGDDAYYDKPINLFKAYLESIIAALSVLVPPVNCVPDDAENSIDLETANAGEKIAELIYKHNNVSLLWVKALFIFCTEGMVACHNYSKQDKKYGTVKKDVRGDVEEPINKLVCPNCKLEFPNDVNLEVPIICPNPECQQLITPTMEQTGTQTVNKIVGTTDEPKSRQCLDAYGGLFVKTPVWARKQDDCLYLTLAYETHFANARDRYPDIRERITPQGIGDEYEKYARLSTQYRGDYPNDNVTCKQSWLRPKAFEVLDDTEDVNWWKKEFPKGVCAHFVNDVFAEAHDEDLDEHWTLTYNPLSDYLQHDPLGLLLVTVQEITNDIISLIVQTIEHGIPQTFADPTVLNFKKYGQSQTKPGVIFPAVPKAGRGMGDSFHEVKTATLSQEIMPFLTQIQSAGQLVSGALPSLFGGALDGSKTASEYSMSRSQALQRLQNTWKIFTVWWKEIFGKVIPAFIEDAKKMGQDERYVKKDQTGKWINNFIRITELHGKIGSVELEANENLPITWLQKKDTLMQLLTSTNQVVMSALSHPDNLPIIRDAIGLTDFKIPNEADRNKQYNEITILLDGIPIRVPPGEEQMMMAEMEGIPPPQEQSFPSLEVDPEIDNHAVEFEIGRGWLISPEGRLAKIENEEGYENVLLHVLQHKQFMMMAMAPPMSEGAQTGENPEKQGQEAPIMGEADVSVQ